MPTLYFRTMCRTHPLRHDRGVDVIGLLALFLIAFVVLDKDTELLDD
jgi:hypothetical protein